MADENPTAGSAVTLLPFRARPATAHPEFIARETDRVLERIDRELRELAEREGLVPLWLKTTRLAVAVTNLLADLARDVSATGAAREVLVRALLFGWPQAGGEAACKFLAREFRQYLAADREHPFTSALALGMLVDLGTLTERVKDVPMLAFELRRDTSALQLAALQLAVRAVRAATEGPYVCKQTVGW